MVILGSSKLGLWKISYAYPLQAVTINLDFWNSLDKTQQDAMLKAADEIGKEQWSVVKGEDKDALDTMAQNGIKIWNKWNFKERLSIVADKC